MNTSDSRGGTPYRVLSFDGGGLHALSYLPLLRDLEQHLGSNIAASNQFDLLVGTSTGAIVAMALKLGAPVDEIIGMYRQHAGAIFKETWIWNRLFFSYRSQVLNRTLTSFIRQRVGAEDDISWRQLANYSRFADLELVVTLWDVGRESSSFLSTRLDRPGQAERLWDATLADIITTCCSAPYFFPPRQFDSHLVYCDGGITGLNNPATFGVSLVTAENREVNRPIDVISLGAGDTTADRDVAEIGDRNAVSIALGTINALIDSSAKLMDSFYGAFGESLGVRNYLRTNHLRPPDSKLDDVEGIDEFIRNFESGRIYYSLHQTADGDGHSESARRQPAASELAQWRQVWEEGFELPAGETQPLSDHATALDNEWAGTSCSTIPSREVLPRWVPRVVAPVALTLILTFVVLAGFAAYQWRRALAEEQRTENAARQLLDNNIGGFEELPKAISSLVVPPLQDEQGNLIVALPERRTDKGEWSKLLSQIDIYKDLVNEEQKAKLVELTDALESWLDDPQTMVPDDELRRRANNAALGFLRVYEDFIHIRELYVRRKEGLDVKVHELAQQVSDDRRRAAYQTALDVMMTLGQSEDSALDQSQEVLDAYVGFYSLYYGGLLIVESREVEGYMVRLGYPLGDRPGPYPFEDGTMLFPLAAWARTGEKPAEFDINDDKSQISEYISLLKREIQTLDSQLTSEQSASRTTD